MKIYGKNSVRGALKFNQKIRNAHLLKSFRDEFIETELRKRKIPLVFHEDFDNFKFASERHQGIILDIEEFRFEDLETLDVENSTIIILDHLEDVHNFGAIIRTCEAFGVAGVIIPKIRSVDVTPTVVHTSAGTIFNTKIVKVTNINQTIRKLKELGFWIVSTDMDGLNYNEIDYSGKIAIVIGNEHKGVSEQVKKNSDYIARIPMKGEVNSLNASVAAGIFISQAMKGK